MPPRVARLGIMRLGAPPSARLGFAQPGFQISLATINRSSAGVRIEGITVTDELNHEPNNASFRVHGFTPIVGHEVKMFLSGPGAGAQQFGGHVLTVRQVYEGRPRADGSMHVAWDCTCIDYTWLLGNRPVITRYVNQSASAILQDLFARYAPLFTTAHVAPDLPVIDEITFTNEELGDAVTRVMERVGGYWYVDYAKDLHAFLVDGETAGAITQLAPRTMEGITQAVDLSQVATRVTARGGGSNAAADVLPGDTQLPIEDGAWYSPSGGVVECGPQRLGYTGVGGDTATGTITRGAEINLLFLPGSPASALNLALAGNLLGSYAYKVTFVIGGGETPPSVPSGPIAATLGQEWTTPGTPAGSVPNVNLAGKLLGVYTYKTTFVIRGGETTPGAASAAITAPQAGADGSGVTFADQAGTLGAGAGYPAGTVLRYRYAFITASGDGPSGPPTAAYTVPALGRFTAISGIPIGPAGTTGRRQYYSVNGSPFVEWQSVYYATETNNTGTTQLDTGGNSGGVASASAFGSHVPTLSGSQISVTAIALGPAGTTARRLYRQGAGAVAWKRVAQLTDNTTTVFTDNVGDVDLGDEAPSASSVVERGARVQLSGLSIGPAGTTARRIYRTVSGGTIYRLLVTITDNTTTTYLDNQADGSLGDAAPTISSVPGRPGDLELQVIDATPFSAAGGWATAGGQLLRYGGTLPGRLIGIPAAGVGSILAPVGVAQPVINAPHLLGVTGILYAITKGDPVNIIVTLTDGPAQAALAAYLGGGNDGIREMPISDGRWSIVEATSRATAELAQRKNPNVTITFNSRDPTIQSGRSITITLTSPAIVGTFKVQRVAISGFGLNPTLWPLRQVECSSRRYSFEDLLRQIRGKAS